MIMTIRPNDLIPVLPFFDPQPQFRTAKRRTRNDQSKFDYLNCRGHLNALTLLKSFEIRRCAMTSTKLTELTGTKLNNLVDSCQNSSNKKFQMEPRITWYF